MIKYLPCFVPIVAAGILYLLPRWKINAAMVRRVLFMLAGAGIGAAIGMLLLGNTILTIVLGALGLAAPLWYSMIIARTGQNADDEQLEITLSVITASYTQSLDLLSSVRNNLPRIPMPFNTIFGAFLRDVETVDPSIKHALARIRSAYPHPRWREWVDACSQCQDDRELAYILPPIVAEIGDARRVSAEVETVIGAAWRDYLLVAGLAIGQVPLMRAINTTWYSYLTDTIWGQLVVVLLFASVVFSAYRVWKINRPLDI